MKTHKFILKSDKYRTARGGYSRFLHGPGPLKRAYLDRIHAPQKLADYQHIKDINKVPKLVCPKCKSLIGTPYIYEKESRKAFLLDPLAFTKKIGKGILF